jgi:hypothetical protein
MTGRTYNDDVALHCEVNEILEPIEPEIFMRVFAEWQQSFLIHGICRLGDKAVELSSDPA